VKYWNIGSFWNHRYFFLCSNNTWLHILFPSSSFFFSFSKTGLLIFPSQSTSLYRPLIFREQNGMLFSLKFQTPKRTMSSAHVIQLNSFQFVFPWSSLYILQTFRTLSTCYAVMLVFEYIHFPRHRKIYV